MRREDEHPARTGPAGARAGLHAAPISDQPGLRSGEVAESPAVEPLSPERVGRFSWWSAGSKQFLGLICFKFPLPHEPLSSAASSGSPFTCMCQPSRGRGLPAGPGRRRTCQRLLFSGNAGAARRWFQPHFHRRQHQRHLRRGCRGRDAVGPIPLAQYLARLHHHRLRRRNGELLRHRQRLEQRMETAHHGLPGTDLDQPDHGGDHHLRQRQLDLHLRWLGRWHLLPAGAQCGLWPRRRALQRGSERRGLCRRAAGQ